MKYFLINIILLVVLFGLYLGERCCTAEAECHECEEKSTWPTSEFNVSALIEKMEKDGLRQNELIVLVDKMYNLQQHRAIREVVLQMTFSIEKENEILEYLLTHDIRSGARGLKPKSYTNWK